MASGEAGRPVIVAGVDGSEDSKQALRWAVQHARFTGAEVHAVIAWQVPVSIFFVPSYTEADYRRDAAETLNNAVMDAVGPDPGVPVLTRVIQNRAAVALTEEAENAELLVVGEHGHGELPGMHLGSVSNYCVHHAPCPVTVVCHAKR